jgi:hypothetical protein
MVFNVIHETGLLEVEASVEVFKEDGQIFCDVQNWSVEGGTWYTHDYAEKRRVETLTLWPSEEDHEWIIA